MDKNQAPLFEKHTPIYPLPDAILTMSKDETICQFCGVSYLIHSEIKKLEDRVKELENDLKNYELLKLKEKQFIQINDEQNLRIQNLEEKLATRVQMISSLSNDIETRELEISRIKKRLQDFENENNFLAVNSEIQKKKMILYDSVVKETMLNISQFKSELKRLELESKDQNKLMIQYFSNLNSQILTFSEKIYRETTDKNEEITLLKNQLNNLSKNSSTQNEQIEFYTKQVDSLQNIKNEMGIQISMLNDELNKSKSLNSKCIRLEEEKRNLMQDNSNLKYELDDVKLKLSTTNSEIDQLRQKFNYHQDTTFKSYEKELKLKIEEANKLKYELESLKKQYEEKDKFEKEILNNHQLNLNEIKSLKYEINRLNNEITDLQNERMSMTLAHQCQITQLKDSFKEKLKLNDDWPEKLANELNKQQEKYNNELKRLETTLKDNFQMEFEIQQQKYNEMYIKYQQISKDFEGNSKSRINDLEAEKQKLASELRSLHEEKLTTEKKLRQDMENLRNITKELHERLEKHTNEDNDTNLKEDLLAKSTKITELENKLKSCETQLENSNSEIKVLQETVHNECMERQELLEKLEETREELLTLKKNAYSSQQLIPLKASINNANFSTFKNGTGLIDINNPPEKLKNTSTYPKTLNEMVNNQKLTSSHSNVSLLYRRNSGSAGAASHSNINNSNNHDTSIRSMSEKSTPESSSKLIENKSNFARANFLLSNGQIPTEPVQLFKKINEMSHHSNNKNNQSLAENKKRISMLLARKS